MKKVSTRGWSVRTKLRDDEVWRGRETIKRQDDTSKGERSTILREKDAKEGEELLMR